MRKRAVILLASACALAPAATPALADESAGGEDLGGESAAREAGERLERAYVRWRHKLRRHDVWHGRDLVQVAHRQERPPSARELSHSIHRMQRRFHSFLRTPRGRAVLFARKVRRIPDWGRSYLSSIAGASRGATRAPSAAEAPSAASISSRSARGESSGATGTRPPRRSPSRRGAPGCC